MGGQLHLIFTEVAKTVHMGRFVGLLAAAFSILSIGCGGTRHFGVAVGMAPVCPYGYYETAPYGCAPDGYYGPEWFDGGAFIGAGPWYRGPRHFYGHVDHDFDVRRGFHGRLPERGERPSGTRVPFRGNALHDSRGHESRRGRR